MSRLDHAHQRCLHGVSRMVAAAAIIAMSAAVAHAEVINIVGQFGGVGTLTGQFDTMGVGSNVVDITFTGLPAERSRTLYTFAVMRPIVWNAAERVHPGDHTYWDRWGGNYEGHELFQWDSGDVGAYRVETVGTTMTYNLDIVPQWGPDEAAQLLSYTEHCRPYEKRGSMLDACCYGAAIFDDGAGGEIAIGTYSLVSGGPFYADGSLTEVSVTPIGGDTWRFSWHCTMTPEPSSLLLLLLGALVPGRSWRTR